MPRAPAVYNESNAAASIAQVSTAASSVAVRTRRNQSMTARGNRRRCSPFARRRSIASRSNHTCRRPDAIYALAQHGRKVEREVDHRVIETFIHTFDGAHDFHKQCRRGR
eukprot:6002346-Pleurochrysis_carterae.AAC.1